MERFLIPYLSADDIVNDARRRQVAAFAELLRREDASPLPPEPEPEPVGQRLRSVAGRIAARLGGRTEGAGA
jgi:hypothetical protein